MQTHIYTVCALYGLLPNVKHMDNNENACSIEPKLVTLESTGHVSGTNV